MSCWSLLLANPVPESGPSGLCVHSQSTRICRLKTKQLPSFHETRSRLRLVEVPALIAYRRMCINNIVVLLIPTYGTGFPRVFVLSGMKHWVPSLSNIKIVPGCELNRQFQLRTVFAELQSNQWLCMTRLTPHWHSFKIRLSVS